MRTTHRLLLLAAVASMAVAVADAQTLGRVAGKVVDPGDEPLEGVKVTVWTDEVGIRVEAETNRKGRFVVAVVDATKSYRIRFEKEGYATLVEPIAPPVGDILRRTWVLEPGAPAPSPPPAASPEEEGGVRAPKEAVEAYNAGAELLRAEDLAAAAAKFEEALAIAPDLHQARTILARIYLRQGRNEEAVAAAEALLADDPGDTDALGTKYDALVALGRTDEAAEVIDELAAVAPGRDTAARVYNLGVAALRAGELGTAAERFEKALELEPGLMPALSALAGVHVQRGEWEAALEMADRMLEREPDNPRALLVRYDAFTRLGDEAKAQAAFETLQGLDPASAAEAFFRQGETLFDQGNAAAAAEAFRKVVDSQPDHAMGHYRLGLALASSGDLEGAKEHLARFLELAPEHPEAPTAREMLEAL